MLLLLLWSMFLFGLVSGISVVGGDTISTTSMPPTPTKKDGRCEEITIPMCRGIGYNWTSMPNGLHHDTQDEAGMEVHQFWPLVEIQCSEDMRFFLCSIYVPICLRDYPVPIPACSSVCRRAEAGCAPLMRKYGFAWPERMQCHKFPEYGDSRNLCMDQRNGTAPPPTAPPAVTAAPPQHPPQAPPAPGQPPLFLPPTPDLRVPCRKGMRSRFCSPISLRGRLPSLANSGLGLPLGNGDDCSCWCRPPLVRLDAGDRRSNRSMGVGSVADCLLPCSNPFFSDDEQWFASLWVALWAAIAALSSALTFATFLIDRPRFRYPERPLIFLSACYVGLSAGYLVRLAAGGRHVVACDGAVVRYGAAPPALGADSSAGAGVGGSASTASPLCVVTFLLVYFFGQAAGIWWVILSLTWFLAAGRKWGSEAIGRCAPYFHLVAWSVPAAQSAAALLLAGVDGDSLAGVCHVGVQQTHLMRWLVLAPLAFHLLLGGGFLLAGLAGLARIRRVLKAQGRPKAEKLEKLMIRIGVFSVLYSVPAAILLGCYAYEVAHQDAWGRRLTCPAPNQCGAGASGVDEHQTPHFSVFMLKYFMTLVVGITSGFWVWSHKTVDSWRKFYWRMCGRRSSSATTNAFQHQQHQQQLQQQLQHQQQQPVFQTLEHQQLMTSQPMVMPLMGHNCKSNLIKQPLMQSVQSHLGSTYKTPPMSHGLDGISR